MNPQERERRRTEIGDEIRRRQQDAGHEGPLPSFLNVFTDKIIDLEVELAGVKDRLRKLERR